MKILHVDSMVSPHQLPLAHGLADRLGADSFRFAGVLQPDSQRLTMGWDCSDPAPWILRVGESAAQRTEYLRWWQEADVVFCGYRETALLEQRIGQGKLTVYFSERWWKPPLGMARLLSPGFLRMAMRYRRMARSSHYHYFAVGRYAAHDMRRITGPGAKQRLWGYFTHLPDCQPDIKRNHNGFTVLYAGRMLAWKRVDLLIRAFRKVLDRFPSAQLNLIGDGPVLGGLKELAHSLGIDDQVQFLPSIPMKQVWQRMADAHAFVLPSNAYEGWGAVVNEAFTYGSVVVASDATGAGASLVKDGITGMCFRSGDAMDLADRLCGLAQDRDLRHRLATEAQREIYHLWSPATAAERLLEFCQALLQGGQAVGHQDGPVSLC